MLIRILSRLASSSFNQLLLRIQVGILSILTERSDIFSARLETTRFISNRIRRFVVFQQLAVTSTPVPPFLTRLAVDATFRLVSKFERPEESASFLTDATDDSFYLAAWPTLFTTCWPIAIRRAQVV